MNRTTSTKLVLGFAALLLAGGIAWAFVLLSPPRKWHANQLPRQFRIGSQTGENSLVTSEAVAANTRAVVAWNAQVTGTKFTVINDTGLGNIGFVNDGLSTITFEDPQNALSGGTLAAATVGYYTTSATEVVNGVSFYRYTDSDVVYNNNVDFATLATAQASPGKGCKPNEYDMEGIAVQEVGHSLGLDHPSIEQASMYGSLGAADFRKTDLDDDDINGIRAIYDQGYTPVNFPNGTTLQVRDLVFGPSTSTIRSNTKAYVYIYVTDNNKNSVSSASVSVSVTFPNNTSGSGTASTGSTGRVVFNLGTYATGGSGYAVTVTSITKAGYSFNSAGNARTHVFN